MKLGSIRKKMYLELIRDNIYYSVDNRSDIHRWAIICTWRSNPACTPLSGTSANHCEAVLPKRRNLLTLFLTKYKQTALRNTLQVKRCAFAEFCPYIKFPKINNTKRRGQCCLEESKHTQHIDRTCLQFACILFYVLETELLWDTVCGPLRSSLLGGRTHLLRGCSFFNNILQCL